MADSTARPGDGASGSGPSRVVVIGFDGIEPDLVRQWAAEGRMPAFACLLAEGMRLPVISPWGLGSGAMWPSLFTGLNPGRNGFFFFRHLVPGTYRTEPAGPGQWSGEPLWTAASRAGRRAVVVDIPKARPDPAFDGIMVCDWLTHGELYAAPVSQPPGLIDDIVRRHGANPTGPCDIIGRTPAEYGLFAKDTVRRVAMKEALLLDLMKAGDWDLFMGGFAEAHCIGHHCWHLHDPDFVGHDAATAAALGDPVRDVYERLDRALAALLDAAPTDAAVLLVLGPGMGPNYNGERVLGETLRRLEGAPEPGVRPGFGVARAVWRRLPVAVRRRLARAADNYDDHANESERARHRFFAIPGNHSHAAIRINLAGRDPQGQVAPGAEYDAVCAELTAGLRELVNLDTGRPVFTDIRRAVDAYDGPRLGILPDLMAEWDRSAPVTRIGSERIGAVEAEFREFRSGDHTMHCELLVRAPGLPVGAGNAPCRTEDVGATIAHLLAAPLPEAEGQPIEALARRDA